MTDNDRTFTKAFKRSLGWGFRRLWSLGPFRFEYLGSWNSPAYSRFGAWRHYQYRGATFRYRAYLLSVEWRPYRIKPGAGEGRRHSVSTHPRFLCWLWYRDMGRRCCARHEGHGFYQHAFTGVCDEGAMW